MLQQILNHKPTTWTGDSDYSNVRYTLHEVQKDSNEYKDVIAPFRLFSIKLPCKIERVQHPYAFGRYLLRKTQMSLAGNNITEKTGYYKISKSDLFNVLDYNLDIRRLKTILHLSKEPSFQWRLENNYILPLEVMVVFRCLQGTEQSSDANYYPTYVIHYD